MKQKLSLTSIVQMRHTTLTSTTEAKSTHSRFHTIMIASCIMERMTSPRMENPPWGRSKTLQGNLVREMASLRLISKKSIPCMNAAVSHLILSTIRNQLLWGEGYCSFEKATLFAFKWFQLLSEADCKSKGRVAVNFIWASHGGGSESQALFTEYTFAFNPR